MSFAYKISKFNRDRKWKFFIHEMSPTKNMRVLDIGFSENEYSDTDNYIEKYYPYRNMLTALGIDTPVRFKERYPEVYTVQYDGGQFPFEDNLFDIAWSNAVIEHVGMPEEQLRFLREIRRVAKRAFITTPNRYFPVEVHTRIPFFHYLPKPLFDKFLISVGKEWASGDYMYLLSLGEIKELLADAGIIKYKIIKNRILGFSMDFIIYF